MSKGGKTQTVEPAKTYAAAAAPEAEETAEAPVLSEAAQTTDGAVKRKKGTSALTIDLNVGGSGGGYGTGVNVPY